MSDKKTNAKRNVGRLCLPGLVGDMMVNHAILKGENAAGNDVYELANACELDPLNVAEFSLFVCTPRRSRSTE